MAGTGMRLLDPLSAAGSAAARSDDHESAQRAAGRLPGGFPADRPGIAGCGPRRAERTAARLTMLSGAGVSPQTEAGR